MRCTRYIALLLLLAGCGDRQEKVIDMSERIPKSTRNYDAPDTSAVDSNTLDLKRYQQLFPELTSVSAIEDRAFIERFHPKSTEKWRLRFSDTDSTTYLRFSFNDSVKCKTAFYNWLDHEGVSYFGANEPIQREGFSMLYGDTLILMVSGSLKADFWREWLEEREWITEGDYLLEQRRYGKTRWYQRQDDEYIELKDE